MFQITTHEAKASTSGSEQHRGRAAIRGVTLRPFGNKTGNEAVVERDVSCGIEAVRVKRQDVISGRPRGNTRVSHGETNRVDLLTGAVVVPDNKFKRSKSLYILSKLKL